MQSTTHTGGGCPFHRGNGDSHQTHAQAIAAAGLTFPNVRAVLNAQTTEGDLPNGITPRVELAALLALATEHVWGMVKEWKDARPDTYGLGLLLKPPQFASVGLHGFGKDDLSRLTTAVARCNSPMQIALYLSRFVSEVMVYHVWKWEKQQGGVGAKGTAQHGRELYNQLKGSLIRHGLASGKGTVEGSEHFDKRHLIEQWLKPGFGFGVTFTSLCLGSAPIVIARDIGERASAENLAEFSAATIPMLTKFAMLHRALLHHVPEVHHASAHIDIVPQLFRCYRDERGRLRVIANPTIVDKRVLENAEQFRREVKEGKPPSDVPALQTFEATGCPALSTAVFREVHTWISTVIRALGFPRMIEIAHA